mmetsp:Transcript_4121/g.9888  ORF Transcript_4121/g.9888 Transcript_4121/m.9888 type:complete len:323 (-) Transcript_4121:168-1136(-)
MHPPSHIKPREHTCYLPKRVWCTLSGHTRAVSQIRFFPVYGHLLLSASMDTTCKLFSVHGEDGVPRTCVRTYFGHDKGVRAIEFAPDGGEHFASASYDRRVKLWDTETGACTARFDAGHTPYCVRFHPTDANSLLAGTHEHTVLQWDVRSGKQVQQYDEHLKGVNSVTFFDEGRRFVTTSDDKKMLVWEFGIPVPIKYVSEPDMHSMPAAALAPDGAHIALQCMDNTIQVYQAGDNVKPHGRKSFRGHMSAGYACEVAFSPDGHYIISGSGTGDVHFWDWRSTKLLRSLRGHDECCISVAWHPITPSRVASAGWDGVIRLYD